MAVKINDPFEKLNPKFYTLVISKKSNNLTTAFKVIGLFTNADNAKDLSSALSLPPVQKTILAQKPVENSYLHTFFDSALISRTWLDIDKEQTNSIFQDMVENALSNSMSPSQAVVKASDQLSVLLK